MIQMVMDARKEKHRQGVYKEVNDEVETVALAELVRLSDKVPPCGVNRNDEAGAPVGTFCVSPMNAITTRIGSPHERY